MKSIVEMFKNKEYEFETESEKWNDGIGTYEYWGAICSDIQPDYYIGKISMIFRGEFDTQEVQTFYDNYNDELIETLLDNIEFDDPETDDWWDAEDLKDGGGIRVFLDFTA